MNEVKINNNLIRLNVQEEQAISNVKNYITGKDYNKDTIEQDVVILGDCYKKYSKDNTLIEFDICYRDFLMKKRTEANNLAIVLLNKSNNIFYQEQLEYQFLPFRLSRDPMIEKKLMESIHGIDDLKYLDIVYSLVDDNIKSNSNVFDKMYNFIAKESIDFESFGHDYKLGYVSPFPETDEEIIANFKIALSEYEAADNKRRKELNKYVGYYAELLEYNRLKESLNENEQLIWVSRYIGDGFGYDIMKYNCVTGFADLYEVKGSIRSINNTKLTAHESQILDYSRTLDDTKYHVIKIKCSEEKNVFYDIYEENNKFVVKDENDKNHILFNINAKDDNNKKIYEYMIC